MLNPVTPPDRRRESPELPELCRGCLNRIPPAQFQIMSRCAAAPLHQWSYCPETDWTRPPTFDLCFIRAAPERPRCQDYAPIAPPEPRPAQLDQPAPRPAPGAGRFRRLLHLLRHGMRRTRRQESQ